MRKDHLNVRLEIFSLLAFLLSLGVIVVLGILVSTIVGIELTSQLPAASKLEEIVESPVGYLLMIIVFVLFSGFPLLTAAVTRRVLVCPEPFPWMDPEEPFIQSKRSSETRL